MSMYKNNKIIVVTSSNHTLGSPDPPEVFGGGDGTEYLSYEPIAMDGSRVLWRLVDIRPGYRITSSGWRVEVPQ